MTSLPQSALRSVLCAVVLAALCSAQPRTLPPVEFTISATDARGNPVTDLKQEDLTITEDGQPTEVTIFRYGGAVEKSAFPKPLGPGLFTNRAAWLPGPTKNVLALVVETPPSDAVLHYLSSLASDMRVAAYAVNPHLTVLHDVNGDPESLASPTTHSPESPAALADSLAALEMIGNHLAAIPGRKCLIWPGPATPVSPSDEQPIRAIAQGLATQGIAVYTAVELMASLTGGRVTAPSSDPVEALKLAATDIRGSYTIGFHPADLPGQNWHAVTVQVRRKGVKLTYRQGYLAENAEPEPTDWPSDEWESAMSSPVSSTAIRLDCRCDLLPVAGGFILTAKVQLPDADLHFRQADRQLQAEVEFAVVEKGPSGEYTTQQRRATAHRPGGSDSDLSSQATEFSAKWKINPDTSSIRLIARDRLTGRYGTLDLPVKSIPPPAAEPSSEPAAEPSPPPTAPVAGSDPFIEKARQASLAFLDTLPNYVVKQNIDREVKVRPSQPWTVQDRIAAEVVYDAGKETTRDVQLNGKPSTPQKVEATGAWSTGQFGTMLKALFAIESAAVFHEHRGLAKVAGREARVYDFSVERGNSQWVLSTGGKTYIPAYEGTVWLDRETARALRFVMRARHLPTDFPFDEAESSTEYGMIRIGSGDYLLPTASVALVCSKAGPAPALSRRGPSGAGRYCARNVIQFHDFKQFGAESNINFGH